MNKITLMEAYLIETLRQNGIDDAEILQKVKGKDVESFKHLHEKFDFTGLYALDEEGILEDVLEEGYQIKYLTFTGLVNILRMKFNKHEGVDYEAKEYTIVNLNLSDEETKTLKQLVSDNWKVSKTDAGVVIQPVHLIGS